MVAATEGSSALIALESESFSVFWNSEGSVYPRVRWGETQVRFASMGLFHSFGCTGKANPCGASSSGTPFGLWNFDLFTKFCDASGVTETMCHCDDPCVQQCKNCEQGWLFCASF